MQKTYAQYINEVEPSPTSDICFRQHEATAWQETFDQFMKIGESEERTVSSAVDDSLGVDSLQTKDINKKETKAYQLDDDVNNDQAPKKEKNITRA